MSHQENTRRWIQAEEKTVKVLITEAGKEYLEYTYDDRARQLLVSQLIAHKSNLPVDTGLVPRTITEDGTSLKAWVFSSLSVAPGTYVLVRVIGLLKPKDLQVNCPTILLATIPRDPVYVSAETPRDAINNLPVDVRQTILEECKYELLSKEAAHRTLQAAIERYIHLQRKLQSGWSSSPAWMATILQEHRLGESEIYTQYEREILRLPYRFQKYIRECLHPEERVLLYVLRPLVSEGREILGLLGKRRLMEGILLITDQQVLFVEDVRSPSNSAGIHWGYVARVFPPERLLDVRVLTKGQTATLALDLWAKTDQHHLEFIFPGEQTFWLAEAESLLRRYLPYPENSKSPRRIYEDKGLNDRDYSGVLHPSDLEDLKSLQELRSSILRQEDVLVSAFTPSSSNNSAKLVSCTSDELLIFEVPDKVSRIDISSISLITLKHSLLGNEMLIRTSRTYGKEIALEINGPIIENFLQLVIFLRRAMVNNTKEHSAPRN